MPNRALKTPLRIRATHWLPLNFNFEMKYLTDVRYLSEGGVMGLVKDIESGIRQTCIVI